MTNKPTVFNYNEFRELKERTRWVPVTEDLPKIGQKVILSTTIGGVYTGYRERPDLVWEVTELDGRRHWVYDPESYVDDVDALPKGEDCSFCVDSRYNDTMLSVSSLNHNDRFEGVLAWMPLPEPYKEGDEE